MREGSQIYCDRHFTRFQAMEYMLRKNIYPAGTIMKNRIKETARKVLDDKYLKI